MLQTSVTVGDIAVIAGLIGTGIWNYFGTIRRVDTLAHQHQKLDERVEDLRRGRGLILEHWPHAFRRLFGFDNGRPPARD